MTETFDGWEKSHKIGEGGEGEVFLAKRVLESDDPERVKKELWKALEYAVKPKGIEDGTLLVTETGRAQDELLRAIQRAALSSRGLQIGALKVIKLRGAAEEIQIAQSRLDREIDAMQRFSSHPSCLRVLHIPAVPRTWFVSEYHARGPLSKPDNRLLYQGKPIKALEDIRGIVDLLAQIHRERAVHRDVATKNVFVASDGRLVLGDWGIVWFQDRDRTRLSLTGDVLGSKDWMPVWVRGRKLEEIPPSFDVYCCAKLLWTIVAGAAEPVPREYWDRDAFNLEKLFPSVPGISFLSEIFRSTIVEREDQCLKDGTELLNLIDVMLTRIRYVPDSMRAAGKRYCLVCGKGTYEWLTTGKEDEDSQNKDRAPLNLMGLSPSPSSLKHVARCTYCGHLQIFGWMKGERPPAWGE